jgi:cell division protein FtsW (lipid II flippase)
MSTRTVDRLFAACLFALGLYIIWNALEYGYMSGTTPGPGFFPFWGGLALALLSAVNVMRSLAGAEILESRFDLLSLTKTLGILALVVVFILITPAVGMLVASGLLIPATAFVIRPRWTRTFAATILVLAVTFPFFCYYLFAVYLRVPVDRGVFGF